MKELVLKKRAELEEICRKTHLIPEIDNAVEYAVDAIESGNFLLSTKLIAIIFFANLKECLFLFLCRFCGPWLCA